MDAGLGPTAMVEVPRVGEVPLALRLHQRLAARVLGVQGDQVALAVQGARLVARLANPERAAELQRQRVARFSVRGFEGGRLLLEHLGPAPGSHPEAAALAADYLGHLLEHLGLPDTPRARQAAQALLDLGQPVTAEAVEALARSLEQAGREDYPAALAAARLRSRGLPLEPALLAVLVEGGASLAELIVRLRRRLRPLAETVGLRGEVAAALAYLDDLLVDPRRPDLAARLRRWLRAAARPLEQYLAEKKTRSGLAALARLVGWLRPADQEAAREAEALLDRWRALHLLHLAPEGQGPSGLDLPLPLRLGGAAAAEGRVRWQPSGGGEAGYAWLRVDLDLPQAGRVAFDLVMQDRRLYGMIGVQDEAAIERARRLLPSLQEGLRGRGFEVVSLRVARLVQGGEAVPEARGAGRLDMEV